ncbi:hypothetical protein [Helicobacter ibis]|uniref:Periplasmic protein n=1 Tax=Helicobacter ibis TaxID=2962633 RepID=A0ABT4VBT1_9HELI|nr:hypothetical protein [Helicobacter ibis]MDA3968161.1 hypothetical protein [Helicobacter ibis]
MSNTEIEVEFEKEPKKSFIPMLLILTIVVLIIFGAGFYLLKQPLGKELLHDAKIALGFSQPNANENLNEVVDIEVTQIAQDDEITRLKEALAKKEMELAKLSNSINPLNQQNAQANTNTLTNIRYVIKPKKQIITECFAMEIGKWQIPANCMLSIATNVNKELKDDIRVVAFEVQGVVDTNPYRGLSPELKQEGLASFRAREAIREINKKIPNAVAFEGPSMQLPNKRGYSIKAYFVE